MAAGSERRDLAGCLDIDLSGSPVTNTRPFRRPGLTPADNPAELRMLSVSFESLAALSDGQRDRALKDGRKGRFEAIHRSFAADLAPDGDAVVFDDPGLFQHVRARLDAG